MSCIETNCSRLKIRTCLLLRLCPGGGGTWLWMGTEKLWCDIKALTKRSNIFDPTFEIRFTTNVWLFGHVQKHCLSNIFWLRQAQNVFELFQKHHATNAVTSACQAMFGDVAKRSNICYKANLKCWSNNVWSFGQGLSYGWVCNLNFHFALKVILVY